MNPTKLMTALLVAKAICLTAPPYPPSSVRDSAARTSLQAQLAPDTKNFALQGRPVRMQDSKHVSFPLGDHRELLFDLRNDPVAPHDWHSVEFS